MKAAIYETFGGPIEIRNLPDPEPAPGGVVIEVAANGICRSDWHGWQGNDPDIVLPHVPGHEMAGTVAAAGAEVTKWRIGDRVTLPFVCGCGDCPQCETGNHQICDHQFQPGFTAWGSFAEFVAIDYADVNLVRLPEEIDFVTAASLGCRFITSYRAIVAQGRCKPGQWVAVHGCGGVGLSAIMIAAALGAKVVAVDIAADKLELARDVGASTVVDATSEDVAAAILETTGGGAHIAIDALGHPDIIRNSIGSLRKRGRHVQVGIMEADHAAPPVPMGPIIGRELEILGSHGMQAHRYPEMLDLILEGKLEPKKLIGRKIPLEESPAELMAMNEFKGTGVTVIDSF